MHRHGLKVTYLIKRFTILDVKFFQRKCWQLDSMRRSVRVCRPKFRPLLRAECGKVLPAVPRSFFFLSFMSLVGLSGRNRLPGISCSSSPDLVSDTRHDWNAGSTLSATALPDAVDAPRRNILFIRRASARQIQNLTVAVVPVRTLPPPLPVGRDSTNGDALSLTRRGGFPGNEVRGRRQCRRGALRGGRCRPYFHSALFHSYSSTGVVAELHSRAQWRHARHSAAALQLSSALSILFNGGTCLVIIFSSSGR